jgi:hypothetical protein
LIAAATSVNALEIGGLIELGASELALLWDSLDDHLWLSAISSPSAERPRERSLSARPPIRVVHYMGTNFGMTGVETFILQLAAAQKRAGLVPSIVMDLEDRAEVQTIMTRWPKPSSASSRTLHSTVKCDRRRLLAFAPTLPLVRWRTPTWSTINRP